MNNKHEFLEDMFIVIMKPTMDEFLKQDNPGELISLYSFYYYTAKWQATNQPKCTTAYASNGMKWTEAKVRKVKKQLCELGLIEDVTERDGGKITGHYIKVKYKLKKITEEKLRDSMDNEPDRVTCHTVEKSECDELHSVIERDTNACSSGNSNACSSGNSNAFSSGNGNACSNGKEIYSRILSHLNEKAGTNFRTTRASTQRHIDARIAEGFTVDDFIKVIDVKCAEWLGTNYDKYLRPDTLFGTKFEDYLNQHSKEHRKQNQPPKDEDNEAVKKARDKWGDLPGFKIV